MQPPPYGSFPMYGGLRPLGVGEVLDQAIQVYRRNFRAFITMTAAVVVPLQVVSVLINLSSRPSTHAATNTQVGGFQFTDTTASSHDATVRLVGFLLVFLIGMIAGRLATGACARGVADSYLGGAAADARSSLTVALHSLGSLLWLELLTLPAIIIGVAFCIAPGIILAVGWVVAVPVLMVENTRGAGALGRSWALTKGRRWPILGLMIATGVLTAVVTSALQIPVIAVLIRGHSTTSTGYIVAAGVSGAISSLLTTPLVAAAYMILYFDLRVRHEGLDIQLVLHNLDSAVTPPAGAPWGSGGPAMPARVVADRAASTATGGPTATRPVGTAATTSAVAAAEPESVTAVAADPAHDRDLARQILNSRRYKGSPVPRPLHGVLRWIGDRLSPIGRWIGDRFSWLPGWSQPWLAAFAIGALVFLVAFAIVSIVRTHTRGLAIDGGAHGGSVGAARDDDPAGLEAAAAEAEARGDLALAVRLRFRAGLLRLDRDAGAITYRASIPAGEVRAQLGSNEFDELADTFEGITYGGGDAEPADAAEARRDWPRVVDSARRR